MGLLMGTANLLNFALTPSFSTPDGASRHLKGL